MAWAGEATEVWRERLLEMGARAVAIETYGNDVRITVVHQAETNVGGLVERAIGGELGDMDYEIDVRGFDPTP